MRAKLQFDMNYIIQKKMIEMLETALTAFDVTSFDTHWELADEHFKTESLIVLQREASHLRREIQTLEFSLNRYHDALKAHFEKK
jgi:hypothetical protein